MKLDFNRKYTIIALYALIVILCGVLFVFAFANFRAVWTYIVNFFSIFMPIFYGIFIAYLIYPMVKFFEWRIFRGLSRKKRYGLARALSLVCVFLILIVSIVLFCVLILPHIIEGYVDLQKMSSIYVEDMKVWLLSLAEESGELSGYVTKLLEYFIGLMENFYAYIVGLFPDIMTLAPALLGFATDFFLGIVLSVYFILAKERLNAQVKKLLRAFFNTEKYRFIYKSARLADRNFGGYIKGQITDSIIVGILSYICLMVIGVPYFPLISTILGIANLIPVIGLWVGIVVGALIIFLANPHAVIWFALLMVVLQFINSKMIRPYIIRVGVDASTMFMFAAIVIMTGLIGFWGLMIGVPVFAILYTILHSEVDKRLSKKGLSVEQVDYYETEAGKELYREREYKRMRKMRGSKKKEESEGDEDFIVKKSNLEDTMEMTACADTMEMNLYKDTTEMKIYKEKISVGQTESESYKEKPTENIVSK